ncbi:hypothetical protein Hanom_Chr04g00297131 [Helianthus anomalus]
MVVVLTNSCHMPTNKTMVENGWGWWLMAGGEDIGWWKLGGGYEEESICKERERRERKEIVCRCFFI